MGEIEIKISKRDGSIKIEGIGYQDGRCVTDINDLQEQLGMLSITEEAKPECTYTVECIRARR